MTSSEQALLMLEAEARAKAHVFEQLSKEHKAIADMLCSALIEIEKSRSSEDEATKE